MTPKERFVRWMKFESVDRPPLMDLCGVWAQTRQRWIAEGMPEQCSTDFFTASDPYFGLDHLEAYGPDIVNPQPAVEERTLEENEKTVLFVDNFGRTRRALKTGTVGGTRMSMDTYMDFPVKDRSSWNAYRFRYEGPAAKRYPADWETLTAKARESTFPLMCSYPFGYYSMLRDWIGTEALSYLWYDDPALVHDMLEFLTDYAIRVMTPAVKAIRFDFVYIHEDLAGKGGPLLGPDTFREFLFPQYVRYIEFLRSNGVQIILVDTDGDHRVLTRLFLDAGVSGLHPFERAAGMDPVRARREYGKSLAMTGGIDKREIARGPAAINAELQRSVAPIIAERGFIPMLDHSAHPDISLKDFQYYLQAKRRLLERVR